LSTLNIVRLADCAEQPWRNGGGTTRVLLTWPADDHWTLRLSVARIERDGPFSPFPGVSRSFAVIDGAGVRLRWPSRELRLTPGAVPVEFDGADPPDGALVDGPTSDLNLMVRQQAGRGSLHAATPGTPWGSASPWRGVYAAGPLSLRRPGINPVDALPGTLLWCADGAHERWQISGGGAAWWIECAPHPAEPHEAPRR
jgi:hypothetical protein